jgi:hypothetical protein
MRVTKRSGEGDWRGYFIQPDELEQIRAIWDSSGAPQLSGDARLRLLQILKKHEAKQRTTIDFMIKTIKAIISHAERKEGGVLMRYWGIRCKGCGQMYPSAMFRADDLPQRRGSIMSALRMANLQLHGK